MKKLLIILTILFSFNVQAETKVSYNDFFPKAAEMKGGSSSWIASDISSEKRDNCTVYERNYSYYSTKKEKILDIERNNTYSVSARVFVCNNFKSAFDTYKKLANTSKKYAKKNQVANVPFGEQGILAAIPPKNAVRKSQHADFYLTYIMRNFIVQVYSNDGFAQMDMAGDIESRINKYLLDSGMNYAVNKINLKISHKKSIYLDSVSFTGDNISSVLINGAVFDANNKPVINAEIIAQETEQKTYTDKNGRFKLNVTAGNGKSISITKAVFLPFAVAGEKKALSTGFYDLSIKKGDKKIFSGVVNILEKNNRIAGSLINTSNSKSYPLTGIISGDNVTLTANCAEKDAVIGCRMIFKGSVVSDTVIKGKSLEVNGGDFVIDKYKYSLVTERNYSRDKGLDLKLVVMDNNTLKYSKQNNLVVGKANNGKSYIQLSYIGHPDRRDIMYFKQGFLSFKVLDSKIKDNATIVLNTLKNKDGKYSLSKVRLLGKINKKDNISVIEFDISSEYRSEPKEELSHYLISLNGSKDDYIVLDGKSSMLNLDYYRDTKNYKKQEVLSGSIKNTDGEDVVSNKGVIEKDGKKDIVLELKVSAQGRKLEQLEVTAVANTKRVWNTVINDIYPVVAVVRDNTVLNNEDGGINIPLNADVEVFDLHLYKGSIENKDINSFTVKAVIDGRTYTAEILPEVRVTGVEVTND